MENYIAWQDYKSEVVQFENLKKEWYKHLILTSSSLFAILISLRPLAQNVKSFSNFFYLFALTSLGLGIIFLSITLYGQIYTGSKVMKLYDSELINAQLSHRNLLPQFYETPILFKIFEYLGYFCFVFTVILLILYLWGMYS